MKKNIVLVCLVFLMVIGFASFAFAYTLNTAGYADRDIDYNESGVAGIYMTAMSNAKFSWNNASVDCTVSTNSGSYNQLATFTTNISDMYGFYQVLATSEADPKHRTTQFRIGMNSDLFPYMSANQRQSVCVHELGHAMGLSDQTSGIRIMNVNRDRSTVYTPQTDDKNGVNANW